MTEVADVIVVGAGPGGATAAYYLASAGFQVLALEKSHYPREKVCGDGLTPRAVRELELMQLPTPREEGWIPNIGLRMVGGGHRLEFPWHEQESFPNYGLCLPRSIFDQKLAEHARAAGADVREGWFVTRLIENEAQRIVGVYARPTDASGRKIGPEQEFRAPVVIAADGVSARLALSQGIERLENRPMGVAVRTYFHTPRHEENWMEGHLEIWEGKPGKSALLPGYGWIFPLGDGTANVGLGTLSAKGTPPKRDHRALLETWLADGVADWEFTPVADATVKGAAIPMAFNRQPHYRNGMMLVGDSGGMVSPFNGEGIAYAMQSARIAAEALVNWRSATSAVKREEALENYARMLKAEWGGYHSLGRVFANLIEHPTVMRICTKYGLPRRTIMHFTHKLLADVYEPKGGDWADRLLATLVRIAPDA